MPWILNCLYALFLLIVSPVICYRAIRQGKYRDGWRQKLLGRLPQLCSGRRRIWFHAVSVGEVLQLETVVRALREARDDLEIVVSTTTRTGLAVAREKFSTDVVCYFPLDFSWAVRRALRCIRPDLIVLVELELWPNFVFAAQRKSIPLALINGRISEKSFRGYRRIRPLMRRLLACFRLLAVQNAIYGGRIEALGAAADRVAVTGSIKFDGIETDRSNARTMQLRESFGLTAGERVFIAGSTQAPEEEYALETWLALVEDFPDLRLILVPRHKERFEEVARLVTGRGLPLLRRSDLRDGGDASHEPISAANGFPADKPHRPVLLLDTLGELSACWGLADVAFVGGSLTNRGGQNMIEPAAYGAAVVFGPNTHNFRDTVELLLANDAARVVHNPLQLGDTLRDLLSQPARAALQGKTAQQLVVSQQGATAKTIQRLRQLIPEPARPSGAATEHAA